MILPSIDIQRGRAVQLESGRTKLLDGGDPLAVLERFAVAGEVAVIDLDAALGVGSNAELIRRMVRRAPCRVGGGIRDLEAARGWLDAGARRVIVGTAATPELVGALPRDRVIVAVDCERGRIVVDGWRRALDAGPIETIDRFRDLAGGFLLTQVEHEGRLAGFSMELVERAVEAAGSARVTAAGGITRAEEIAQLARLGADAQVGMALYGGHLTLGQGVAAALDGGVESAEAPGGRIWPTAVCDPSGRALGLVWSTRASVAAAVDDRSGIYWSRSRRSLWPKGATSGNTQELVRVDLDCDRDALRFTVRQRGGFCHTGARGCWPELFSLGTLERTIDRRATGRPVDGPVDDAVDGPVDGPVDGAADGAADGATDPGGAASRSGTRRLLDDSGLLAAKLSEEAGELARAEGRRAVTHEAADLIYFALVAARRSGVDLEAIEGELELRGLRLSRRPMRRSPAGSAS